MIIEIDQTKEFSTHTCQCYKHSEFSNNDIFVNAFPWLFPGGIGDPYDPETGEVDNLREWADHLLRYEDGRFSSDQVFTLYVHNYMVRHDNNSQGRWFFQGERFLGKNPPTLNELKCQIRDGNFTFIDKLRYFASEIRGSDNYWRAKTRELNAWIDYHVSCNHGPPTHFITFSCAENWWPDLRRIVSQLEFKAGRRKEAVAVAKGDPEVTYAAVKRHPIHVNEFFMQRAQSFLDGYAREVLDLEYYWGRVEFAPGRGQIHLHLLGITKDRAYLDDFYNATTESEKIKVLESYATEKLDMTADVQVDEKTRMDRSKSPLASRYCETIDPLEDARFLAQECMLHKCGLYCLDDSKNKGKKDGPRSCRFECGKESERGKCDTPGWERHNEAYIHKDRRGIEHLRMRRTKSRRITQHSRALLQAWRANVDVQLLVYRSNPNIPDVNEIQSVCQYVVAYAGKRYHTKKSEVDAIQNIIIK